jgi:DNA adenine methylase
MLLLNNKHQAKSVKSPLNYIGGKQKILDRLLNLFPKEIRTFVDLFTGGGNVGLNVKAERVICNDNLTYLIDMYRAFQTTATEDILNHIHSRIREFHLSLSNEYGYLNLRKQYNRSKHPLDLFTLIAYSFNHQIRFNNRHEFNNPFGRERSSFNVTMQKNLIEFVQRIQTSDVAFTCTSFEAFDFTGLSLHDFVYCDPPYLITTGTYNDGRRGFKGWAEREENELLQLLESLHEQGVPFALSNVLSHKGKTNTILIDWVKRNEFLRVTPIAHHYANSSYQTRIRDKDATEEVLITNYEPAPPKELSLFDV